jgi:tetratricopeptide (TPR) repeat protein
MFKWYRYAPFSQHFTSDNRRHSGGLVAVCVAQATLILVGPQIARGEQTWQAAKASEGSTLVATSNAPPSNAAAELGAEEQSADDAIVPVAQISEDFPTPASRADENGITSKYETPQLAGAPSIGFGSFKTMQRGPAEGATNTLEPVEFQRIKVGQTTKQKLLEEWGDPADTVATAEGSVLAFEIDPFQAVEVLVGEGEIVVAIKIALASPLDAKQLAEQLSLSEIRPVAALDETDEPLGLAFPERGVIFMYGGSDADAVAADGELAAAVSHVVLQRLDPLAFAMRAERSLHGQYTQNIKDLKTAIQIDPHCAHAHSLLARIYLATGQADLAAEAAQAACDADPANDSYQLLRGRALEMQGKYDDAVLTVRAVLDRENLTPIDKSQALHQMGCLASLGDVEIASKAISFHTRAIEAADPLATSTNGKERRAAKQILVEAHLAIGEEIARQSFNEKVENLSQWIGRASGIAEEYIKHDGGSIELRLLVAQRALAALASFRPTLDPAPWVKEANEAAQDLLAQSNDELWLARMKWELGLAYLNALRVEHIRRETENALRYGNLAVEYLAHGAKTRQAVHASEEQIGLLYFQMGAVQAVHQLDHAKAAKWYDKAEPLLSGPLPTSELYTPRREGEMLVSMGVTYWQIGDKQRAVTLTQNGVALVEAAVEAGILARTTLGVPYGNLATMYQKLGESKNAAKYNELARSVTGTSEPPRANSTLEVQQTSNTSGKSAKAKRSTSQR